MTHIVGCVARRVARAAVVPALVAALAVLHVAAGADPAQAQRRQYRQGGDLADIENTPYDGRFTFARIRFEPTSGGGRGWRRDLKWDHDVPRAERNFTKILRELTTLRAFLDGGNIFTLDDPELFKYPIAYICEVGFWAPTEKEAAALRAYLLKGGFLIVDDFAGYDWMNFAEAMRQVLPEGRLVRLDLSHPIFVSFFRIESLEMAHPNYGGAQAEFWGVFEDNDPKKRLMVVVNYNNDIGDYWEFSDTGRVPIELSNEAYKLGVNYVIYAMTH
jgi:hypothetical protein